MTRTTTVSGIRPDKAGDGEWIDINGHVGRLMSTLMADGRPFSIDVTPGGMTTVTPLPPPKDAEAAGGDAQAETEPPTGGSPAGRRCTTGSAPGSRRTSPKENNRKEQSWNKQEESSSRH